MSDSDSDDLSAWDFAPVLSTLLSAGILFGMRFGPFDGRAITPCALAFVIGVLLDFFSGSNWASKVTITFQILLALTVLAAITRFFGGMDH